MRLHALTATAFGPFAGTVSVDFDDLTSSGLFLLTGPTGAGKTSVLDAVCFALFGQVPGDRHLARHLRCDQAADGVAPQVVLELSVRGRRFRFTRSPQWERAKKRGSGTTRVQAHVVVEELRGGEWLGLTNRLDDAGLLVTDLVGMTCAQFTQVAMLPQGQFMTFLRSKSQERQAVLQRLFRTDRFEQVERWLVERRIGLRRTNQSANDEVARLLARLQEAADAQFPEDWDTAELATPAETGDLLAWADAQVSAARDWASASAAHRRESVRVAETAHDDLQTASALARSRSRAAQAQSQREALDAEHADVDDARRALDAHQRAVPVARVLTRAAAAAEAARTTSDHLAQALAAAADLLPDGSVDDRGRLDDAHDAAVGALAVAERFVPRERELRQQRQRMRVLAARVADDERTLEELGEEVAELPRLVTSLRDQRDQARARAMQLPAAQAGLTQAEELVARAERRDDLAAQIEAAQAEVAAATARAQELRERYLDARERRITGMAAELATALAVGCACPVCGSAEHPSPAAATQDAVTRDDEEAARRSFEGADFDRQVREGSHRDLVLLRKSLDDELSGAVVETLRQTRDEAATAVVACEQAARDAELHDRELERLETTRAHREAQLKRLEVALSHDRAALTAAEQSADALSDELATLLGDGAAVGPGADTAAGLAAFVERHREAAAALDAVRAAHADDVAAQALRAQSATAAAEAVQEAGFPDEATARGSLLAQGEATTLAERVAQHDEARQRVSAILAEPGLTEALEQPEPDLTALREAAADAATVRDAAASAAHAADRRVARVAELRALLATSLDSWAPLRRQYALTASLAALVEGKGVDNPQRIRLSAYVLAERLRSVVDAANERLTRMSGGRYELEHTDDKGAGDQRGGLGLLVRDSWSGRTRDPATLSGGETFVVSLALALGLADTVSHEAGGTDIDTLFIDEGFGTLDSATLDDVMDTLDTLREGGRVVGLVSHVAELRQRIPLQLEVTTSRQGSTLRPVTRSA